MPRKSDRAPSARETPASASYWRSFYDVDNLIINTRRLIIRDKGGITTQSISTFSPGQGGNLTINASESVEITDGFISALSQGTGRAGNISINVRDTLQDPSELIVNTCIGRSNRRQDKFIITGRGGLPPNPRQVLRSQAVQVDWVTLDAGANNPTEDVQSRETQRRVSGEQYPQIDNNVNTKTTEIVEAQGWVVDANGKITLVATAPAANPHSPWFTPASCPVR